MIKFIAQKKHITGNSIKDMTVNISNKFVENIVKELNNKYSKIDCKNHPKHLCTITYKVTDKSFIVTKSNFCCKEFEELIEIAN